MVGNRRSLFTNALVFLRGGLLRQGASMAYDPSRRAPFLFGGLGQVKPCIGTPRVPPDSCGGLYYMPNQWLDDSWHFVRKP